MISRYAFNQCCSNDALCHAHPVDITKRVRNRHGGDISFSVYRSCLSLSRIADPLRDLKLAFERALFDVSTMNDEDETWKLLLPISVNVVMSMCAYSLTVRLIPRIKSMFVKANLYGVDMSKRSSGKV